MAEWPDGSEDYLHASRNFGLNKEKQTQRTEPFIFVIRQNERLRVSVFRSMVIHFPAVLPYRRHGFCRPVLSDEPLFQA